MKQNCLFSFNMEIVGNDQLSWVAQEKTRKVSEKQQLSKVRFFTLQKQSFISYKRLSAKGAREFLGTILSTRTRNDWVYIIQLKQY